MKACALNVRLAEPTDTAAIVELMDQCLRGGRAPRSAEFFLWKHAANPFGRSSVLLAFDGDRLVGMRAFMRWRFQCKGRTIEAVRAVDTVTHPGYRGQGIFRMLTLDLIERVRAEGVAFVFNTPNDVSRSGYLKMGWRDVSRLDLWARPSLGPRRDWSLPSGCPVKLAEHPEFDLLIQRASQSWSQRLRTVQDSGYMKWRYAEIPGLVYGARAGGSPLDAAIVYSVRRRRGVSELTILETWVVPSVVSVLRAGQLIRGLIGESGVTYAVASAPDRSARAALIAAGFVPMPRSGPRLTARLLCGTSEFLRASSWSYSVGDMELF